MWWWWWWWWWNRQTIVWYRMLCVFLCCTDTEVYDPVFWNGRASEARLDWAPHTLPRYENKTKLDCGNSDPERFQFFFLCHWLMLDAKIQVKRGPLKNWNLRVHTLTYVCLAFLQAYHARPPSQEHVFLQSCRTCSTSMRIDANRCWQVIRKNLRPTCRSAVNGGVDINRTVQAA